MSWSARRLPRPRVEIRGQTPAVGRAGIGTFHPRSDTPRTARTWVMQVSGREFEGNRRTNFCVSTAKYLRTICKEKLRLMDRPKDKGWANVCNSPELPCSESTTFRSLFSSQFSIVSAAESLISRPQMAVSAVTNRTYPALSHHHTRSFLNLPLHIQVMTKLGFVAFSQVLALSNARTIVFGYGPNEIVCICPSFRRAPSPFRRASPVFVSSGDHLPLLFGGSHEIYWLSLAVFRC